MKMSFIIRIPDIENDEPEIQKESMKSSENFSSSSTKENLNKNIELDNPSKNENVIETKK